MVLCEMNVVITGHVLDSNQTPNRRTDSKSTITHGSSDIPTKKKKKPVLVSQYQEYRVFQPSVLEYIKRDFSKFGSENKYVKCGKRKDRCLETCTASHRLPLRPKVGTYPYHGYSITPSARQLAPV